MARAVQLVAGSLGLCLCFMIWTVPLAFAAGLGLAVALLLSRSSERWAVALVTVPLLLLNGLVEVVLRRLPPDAGPQYFRPHEFLEVHDDRGARYRPSQSLPDFAMPYGDLGAISRIETLFQPRKVDFHTDSRGNRNRGEYAGQELVVFGDSFAAGSGNPQSDLLAEVLSKEHGLPTYNAAHPGGLDEYVARFRTLQAEVDVPFRGILVLFEGNDFQCRDRSLDRMASRFLTVAWHFYVPPRIRKLHSYRLFYGLTRRALAGLSGGGRTATAKVLVESVGGLPMAFYQDYVRNTRHPERCAWEAHRHLLRSVAPRTALIVLVPTKYRVYRSVPGGETPPPSEVAAFLRDFSKELGVPFLDLTPALVAESARLLSTGETTFWRDDSHWNGRGVRVAAAAVARVVSPPDGQNLK